MNDKNVGLLEYLASGSGCMYLSDLHLDGYLSTIKRLISEIKPVKYSVWEWNDAVFYITGKRTNFETQTEAKEFLINFKS